MGNVLKSLYSCCCKPTTTGDSDFLGLHGVSTTSVSALAYDLVNFEITSQVPEGLSNHVVSSKKSQAKWYRKLLQAWKEAKPPPKTAPEAAYLVIQTLSKHQKADVEGLLAFYGLPLLQHSAEIPASFLEVHGYEMQTLPDGVQFEMQTLPVDAKAVGDGDGMTVYVSTSDPRESVNIPREVLLAAVRRSKARARKNYTRADALHQKIIDSGYRVIFIQNEEVLAKKYRIRLRGIDAPEMAMPYGNEAKDVLTKLVQGKCLRVFVYGEDQFGRIVCDAYCNGVFVQEVMLKKGFAWHHKVYDQRVKFANWENEARGKRIGLWASANPEKPWEWKRRNKREG